MNKSQWKPTHSYDVLHSLERDVFIRAMDPLRNGRQRAIVDLDQVQKMLSKTEQEPAHPGTKLAVRLLALTTVCPRTLATTPWSELSNLGSEQPVWQIPAERMKLRLHYKDDRPLLVFGKNHVQFDLIELNDQRYDWTTRYAENVGYVQRLDLAHYDE